MSSRTHVLTDVSTRTWVPEFRDLVPGSQGPLARVDKYTLRGGMSDGVDVIEVDNGQLKVWLLPTRGMGLWKGEFAGRPLGWQSPVAQPVHPAFVNAHDRGGIGWLTGFNEWLCRCGLDANGPPGDGATLHGRIANLPAWRVTVTVDPSPDGGISVTGVVDETSLFGACLRLTSTLTLRYGASELTLVDQVTNLAGRPADLQLLYHTQFGPPFLEEGAEVVLPAARVVPRDARAAEGHAGWQRFLGPQAGYAEQVYYAQPSGTAAGETGVLLHNAAGNLGVSLGWNTHELPCFALWKNTQATADGYCVGLEPATNFPNLKAYERTQGRVKTVAPGGSHTVRLRMAVHTAAAEVAAEASRLRGLLSGRPTEVCQAPQAGWTPAGEPAR